MLRNPIIYLCTNWNTHIFLTDFIENFDPNVADYIPAAPNLNVITPNPDIDGYIELTWSFVSEATEYNIFRSDSVIERIEDAVFLGTSTGTSFGNDISTDGEYYFAITAVNLYGESNISNSEKIVILIGGSGDPEDDPDEDPDFRKEDLEETPFDIESIPGFKGEILIIFLILSSIGIILRVKNKSP